MGRTCYFRGAGLAFAFRSWTWRQGSKLAEGTPPGGWPGVIPGVCWLQRGARHSNFLGVAVDSAVLFEGTPGSSHPESCSDVQRVMSILPCVFPVCRLGTPLPACTLCALAPCVRTRYAWHFVLVVVVPAVLLHVWLSPLVDTAEEELHMCCVQLNPGFVWIFYAVCVVQRACNAAAAAET